MNWFVFQYTMSTIYWELLLHKKLGILTLSKYREFLPNLSIATEHLKDQGKCMFCYLIVLLQITQMTKMNVNLVDLCSHACHVNVHMLVM